MERTLVSVSAPAPGWRAVFAWLDGNNARATREEPIACWGVYDVEGERQVVPMVRAVGRPGIDDATLREDAELVHILAPEESPDDVLPEIEERFLIRLQERVDQKQREAQEAKEFRASRAASNEVARIWDYLDKVLPTTQERARMVRDGRMPPATTWPKV